MAKNRVFVLNDNDDLVSGLVNSGYQVKTADDEDREKKIRVGILRSDCIINNFDDEILSNEAYYNELKNIKSTNNKPIINFLMGDDLDDTFDKVYQNEDISDDTVLKADDFKNTLSDYANNIDSLIEELIEKGITPDEELAVKKEEPVEEAVEPIEDEVESEPAEDEVEPEEALEEEDSLELEENDEDLELVDLEESESNEETQEENNNEEIQEEKKEEIISEVKPVIPAPAKVVKILKNNPEILKKAMKKFDDGEYNEAFDLFRETEDNPTAMEYIGYAYLTGRGVYKDEDAAFKWYSEAVDNEN